METQLTIADVLNQLNEPIGPGDYVEHTVKPGVILQVVNGPYLTVMKNIGLDVRDQHGHILPVLLKYVHRV